MRPSIIAPRAALAALLGAAALGAPALGQGMSGQCMQRGNMLSPANGSGYNQSLNPMLSGGYLPYNQSAMQQNYLRQQMQQAYYQQQLQQAYQLGQADQAEQKAEQAAAERKRAYWQQRRADKVARRGTVKAKLSAAARTSSENASPARHSAVADRTDLAGTHSAAR
jgi:hypothetical protein